MRKTLALWLVALSFSTALPARAQNVYLTVNGRTYVLQGQGLSPRDQVALQQAVQQIQRLLPAGRPPMPRSQPSMPISQRTSYFPRESGAPSSSNPPARYQPGEQDVRMMPPDDKMEHGGPPDEMTAPPTR